MAKGIIETLIRELWNGEIALSFIPEERDVTLRWVEYEFILKVVSNSRGAKDSFTCNKGKFYGGYTRVTAVSDGALRFTFNNNDGPAYWPRAVSCLALEVFFPFQFINKGKTIHP